MASVPGYELVPARERQMFCRQFEQDLQLVRLFLLLLNRSCPVKNVDLVWAEQGPAGRVRLRHLGTTEELASPCSRTSGLCSGNPHPTYCNIINDYGRREVASCWISDKAAETRARRTGKSQVYTCQFGLTDIAVPVIVEGRLIATLYTGQVHRKPPTRQGFEKIAKAAGKLGYVDLANLERAYWNVPVVTGEDIRITKAILESFAQCLANSWLRLAELVRERRRKDRELQIARREFACLAMEAGHGSRAEKQEVIRRLGFTSPPNRAIVVRLDPEKTDELSAASFDMNFTAALQAIEEICEKLENVAVTCLRKSDICIFFNDPTGAGGRHGDFYAHRLSSRVVHAVAESSDLRVRVGIGSLKSDWHGLSESHQEACAALLAPDGNIASFKKATASFNDLSQTAERIFRLIKEQSLDEAKAAMDALPVLISRIVKDPADLTPASLYFSSVLESSCFAARELGCDSAAVTKVRGRAAEAFDRAPNIFELNRAWSRSALELVEEVRRLYGSKRKKLVDRACQTIRRHVEDMPGRHRISIKAIASELGISTSHFSRVFKHDMGVTFERFVMAQRVELAKRLLLDPVHNISQVAQRCGFKDPSYFSRVFRTFTGHSPREFCDNPLCCQPNAGTLIATASRSLRVALGD